MSSIFSRIIAGEIPGRFVWADEHCVGLMDANPQTHGHVLVVARDEIDQWTDLGDELRSHLFDVAAIIGRAVKAEFNAPRAGLVIAGFGVPHVHIHVLPADDIADLRDTAAMHGLPAEELDADAERVRDALRRGAGQAYVVGPGPLASAT